jgi:3-hydroxyacyl-CoA dehydrogenase/enoyl-CoA hydratase/3-hydroxybutyryl-CoA epimerase
MYRVTTINNCQMGFPSIKLGLIPGAGATVRLPKLVGLSNALKIVLYGENIDSSKGKTVGLIDLTFDKTQDMSFITHVKQYSQKLIVVKRKPPPLKGYRYKALNENFIGRWVVYRYQHQKLGRVFNDKYPAPYYALASLINIYKESPTISMDFESMAFGKMVTSPESKALLAIHFMVEKAKNLPFELSRTKWKPISQIGILGAGSIGSALAHTAAINDVKVFLQDTSEALRKGSDNMSLLTNKLIKKDVMTSYELDQKMKLITSGTTGVITSGDLIIDASSESKETKISVLKSLESLMAGGSIFATTTSSFSITDLANSSKFPENVVGIHFYRAPNKTSIVEIVRGKKTSVSTLATLYKFAVSLKKTPIVVNDGPGFVLNRILFVYQCEACRLLKEGGTVKDVDAIFENFGFESGPFRMLDELGLDVALQFGSNMKSLGDRFVPFQELELLVNKGMKGKKSGVGFYIYKKTETNKKERVSSEITAFTGKQISAKLYPEEILDRCLLLMINEASYILHEGIASSGDDIDLALVEGIGFAPFRGGILAFADNRGIRNVVSRLKALAKTHGKRFEPSPLLESMGSQNLKFFPNRPNCTYVERRGTPQVIMEGAIKARL